jgi:hypothetical protein
MWLSYEREVAVPVTMSVTMPEISPVVMIIGTLATPQVATLNGALTNVCRVTLLSPSKRELVSAESRNLSFLHTSASRMRIFFMSCRKLRARPYAH